MDNPKTSTRLRLMADGTPRRNRMAKGIAARAEKKKAAREAARAEKKKAFDAKVLAFMMEGAKAVKATRKAKGKAEKSARKAKTYKSASRKAVKDTSIAQANVVKVRSSVAHKIVAALLTSDDSLTTIAGRLGITKQRVSQIYLKALKAGVKIRLRSRGRSKKRT